MMEQFVSIIATVLFVFVCLFGLGYYIWKRVSTATVSVNATAGKPTVSEISNQPDGNLEDKVIVEARNYYSSRGIECMGKMISEDYHSFSLIHTAFLSKFNEIKKIAAEERTDGTKEIIFELTNFTGQAVHKAFWYVDIVQQPCKNYNPSQGNWNLGKKVGYPLPSGELVFDMVRKSIFLYPDPNKEFSIKKENFTIAEKSARVKYTPFIEKGESRVYTIIKSPYGMGYKLKPSSIDSEWKLRQEEINTNYPNLTISGPEGTRRSVPTENISVLLERITEQGISIGFIGEGGTGKSRLMYNLIYSLGNETNTNNRIIYATPDTLRLFSQSGEDMDTIFDSSYKNIVVIEEAGEIWRNENEGELYKSLSDGILSKHYNISFLFTLNALGEEHKALTREGRAVVVFTDALSVEQTKAVISRLRKENEQNPDIYLDEKYASGIKNPTALSSIYYYYMVDRRIAEIEKIIADASVKANTSKQLFTVEPVPLATPPAPPVQVTKVQEKTEPVAVIKKRTR